MYVVQYSTTRAHYCTTRYYGITYLGDGCRSAHSTRIVYWKRFTASLLVSCVRLAAVQHKTAQHSRFGNVCNGGDLDDVPRAKGTRRCTVNCTVLYGNSPSTQEIIKEPGKGIGSVARRGRAKSSTSAGPECTVHCTVPQTPREGKGAGAGAGAVVKARAQAGDRSWS